jgi:hypothetical protein
LFCPEASNVLIVDAEGVEGMGMRRSQASHVTDIVISHSQTVGCVNASASPLLPKGLIEEIDADGIPASGATE